MNIGEALAKLPDEDWWNMIPDMNYSYAIEWTPKHGGWCRTRMLNSDEWLFDRCTVSTHAVKMGNNMLVKYV